MIDQPSKEYFLRTRANGEISKMEAMTSRMSEPSFIQTTCETGRARLKMIEDLLKSRGSAFLMGDQPSHADGCLFGWYAFSRLNQELVSGVWEHESLPEVKAWVERMIDRGLAKREDLY